MLLAQGLEGCLETQGLGLASMGQCAPLQINPCLELTVLGLPEATGKGLSKEIAHLYWFGGELQTSMGLRLDFLCDSVSPLKKKSSEMVGKPT